MAGLLGGNRDFEEEWFGPVWECSDCHVKFMLDDDYPDPKFSQGAVSY